MKWYEWLSSVSLKYGLRTDRLLFDQMQDRMKENIAMKRIKEESIVAIRKRRLWK